MKSIPLSTALALLENASAVIIDDAVTYPELTELTGESDNQFLRLSWDDHDEGLEYTVAFAEGANSTATIEGASLWLTATDGESTQITILVPADLPSVVSATWI